MPVNDDPVHNVTTMQYCFILSVLPASRVAWFDKANTRHHTILDAKQNQRLDSLSHN